MSQEQQQPNPSETSGNGYSQTEIIDLLQKTIQQLDRIVNQLNTEAIATLPSKNTLETLVASTEALATSVAKTETETPLTPETTPVAAIESVPSTEMAQTEELEEFIAQEETVPSEEGFIDRLLPSFSSLQNWWDGVLDKIRSLLPAPLQEKLSDWTLTGILAGTVVTLLLTSVLLFPQQPQPATEIVEAPPEVIETPQKTPEIVETPPELKAPGRPEPVEVLPPPQPELSPEQSLIASIQEQVAAITSQYPEGLILSVEANFLGSRLIVTVGDDWYQLNSRRQDKLANSILQRSQKLDFRKLELVNSQGNLLARNPVVGDKMVILKREV
jgi:hypothetical protein